MGIGLTSVADGVPFNPDVPSFTSAERGNLFHYNPTTGLWDQTDSLAFHEFSPVPLTVTTSLNGSYSITTESHFVIFVEGSAVGFSLVLPNATTKNTGLFYKIFNNTGQPIMIKDYTGTILGICSQTSAFETVLQDNTTQAGTWKFFQTFIGSASGIVNYNLISSTAFSSSTRTPSFQLITGFSITPTAGTYAVWYSASVFYTTTPKAHYWAIYKNGTQIADSLRQQDTAHSNQTMIDSTQTIVTTTGTEAIDVRVSCANTGTLTVNQRSLILIRLGG